MHSLDNLEGDLFLDRDFLAHLRFIQRWNIQFSKRRQCLSISLNQCHGIIIDLQNCVNWLELFLRWAMWLIGLLLQCTFKMIFQHIWCLSLLQCICFTENCKNYFLFQLRDKTFWQTGTDRRTNKRTDRRTDGSYLVVLHEGGDPGLDCVHNVIHQVNFHLCPTVVGKVTYVNGSPHLRLGQVVTIVIKILWFLIKKKEHILLIQILYMKQYKS